jgi:FtsH-binding integral membrane protein
MLPQETKDHLAKIYWAFMAGLLASCFMYVIAKTIGHHAALTCGPC